MRCDAFLTTPKIRHLISRLWRQLPSLGSLNQSGDIIMKRTFKKTISLLLSIVLAASALFAVPITSNAISKPGALESTGLQFWVDSENTLTQSDIDAFTSGSSKTTMVGAVGVYKRSTDSNYYYLFLPSNADCSRLKVWFNSTSTVSVGSTTLQSGQETDVFRALDEGGIKRDYTLKIDSNSYQLVAMKSGEVGTVYIDTQSGSISKINGSSDHSVNEPGTVMVVAPDGTVEYDGDMEKLQGRGNATWSTNNNKNPYGFKLTQSTSLLGLGKGKKWVLLANANDSNSLLKNQIIYDFSKYIGINYQPTCKPVDLYVNQQYYGSYQLCEKVEIKSSRVNVNDSYEALQIANGTVDSETGAIIPADFDTMSNFETRVFSASGSRLTSTTGASCYSHTIGARKYSGTTGVLNTGFTSLDDPVDVTGGYVFEMEISNRWRDENTGFCAYNRQGWVVKSHDYVSKNMADYCYDLLYALGSAIYNGGTVPSTETSTSCNGLSRLTELTQGSRSVTNPVPAEKYIGKRWSDIIDADSAVRNYWVQEFFKNIDSSITSNYFYKDSDSIDSKLYAGPAWDFDNALEFDRSNQYRWGMNRSSTEGWYAKNSLIYSWRDSDHSTSYTSTDQSPLGFYAALATNCSDFDLMAKSEWYSNVSTAVDVLLGNTTDPKGILKSTEEYTQTIRKTGTMNNARFDVNSSNEYNASSITSGINNWISSRKNWINSQFGTVDISGAAIEDIPAQSLTGDEIKPSIKATYGGVELKEGKDYTLSYQNNISAGNATVTVSGIGYYSGSATRSFTINAGTLVGTTVSIRDGAYKGDTLRANVINKDGNEINKFITYQWYKNGEAISGATESEYTVAQADAGSTLLVKITGDGQSFETITIASNECSVYEGEKPENYTETLAAWEYDYIADSSDIVNADLSGNGYAYNASSGQLADLAKLAGSVNASDTAKIKWSGLGDEYKNGSPSGKTQVPVMGTSKSNNLAWGEYPYFETSVSTKRYENICFSAMLGGSKMAPRDWKLQYSLNGRDYYDIPNASYSITNNKEMQQAFRSVPLPDVCADRENICIRAVACEDVAINGIDVIVGSVSGDAAINNVKVTGTKISAITHLDEPEISSTSQISKQTVILDTDKISIQDTNGGADVYYSIDGCPYQLYTGAFNPFGKDAVAGKMAVVSAYSMFNSVISETSSQTYTYAGDNINQFDFENCSDNVSNGIVFSNGGAFGKSAKMTANTDGVSQFVPLWNEEKKAYSISPDDGAKWSEDSGFYFEFSTSGYKNITFSAKLFTTNLGPENVYLQYSLDKNEWLNAVEYQPLRADGAFHQSFDRVLLMPECNNRAKVYVRVVTVEDITYSGEALHNNQSKGNLYINDIYIGGDENGDIKMPYTNKTSDFFGKTGTIKYYSPDDKEMFYTVSGPDNKIILSGRYVDGGISIANAPSFNQYETGAYKISIRAGDDDDSSITNTRYYYFKGDSIAEFAFDGKNTKLEDYLNDDCTVVSNSGGNVASSLSFRPNGSTPIELSYGDKFGIKASYSEDNGFAATKVLDNPDGNGCYLIRTSTKGYRNISINAEQICSNKAPRDWGIAYSTNGVYYTYVPSSNVRASNNELFDSTVETYNNFRLPSACDNQDNLFIKIFINGGESVDATELEDVTKGNTGINNIEISGVAIPQKVNVTVKTFLLKSKTETDFNCPVAANYTMGDETLAEGSDTVTVALDRGNTYTIAASANGTFRRNITFTAEEGIEEIRVGIVALDFNADGIINAKDYARIVKITNDYQNRAYSDAFRNFINSESDGFTY